MGGDVLCLVLVSFYCFLALYSSLQLSCCDKTPKSDNLLCS